MTYYSLFCIKVVNQLNSTLEIDAILSLISTLSIYE